MDLAGATVLELCAGMGVAVFAPHDVEAICRAAEVVRLDRPASLILHPMVGSVR